MRIFQQLGLPNHVEHIVADDMIDMYIALCAEGKMYPERLSRTFFNVAPPFHAFTVSYRVDGEDICVFVRSQKTKTGFGLGIIVPAPVGAGLPFSRLFGMHCTGVSTLVTTDEEGRLLSADVRDLEGRSTALDFAGQIGGPSCFALLVIQFMHCKNVEQIVEAPSEKLRKKHERKHGVTLRPFRRLKVTGIRKALQVEGGLSTNGLTSALHVCRGHFATYTAEAPLFGRTVGTFWVPQHARGSAERGTVTKVYEVSPDVEQPR